VSPHLPASVSAAEAQPAAPATSTASTAEDSSVLTGDKRVLIPLAEAAERMGISPWQAYKLAKAGRLPTTRPGKRHLYVPAAALRRIEREGLPPEGGEVA
jgi:excisionase family DNA binding protein